MALVIFPVEVWEVVLEKLEASTDVQNVFKAYPELELEGVLRTKRQLWMFDQVIPQLFPAWLTPKDILSCRQVCRQWSLTVNAYLETYALRNDHEIDNVLLGRNLPSRACLPKEFYFPQYFINPRLMHKFTHDMEDSPPNINPIIGRSISLSKDSMLGNCRPGNPLGYDYWLDDTMKLLGKCGNHIWTLRIHNCVIKNLSTPIRQLLIDVLDLTPNLKRLQLEKITKVRPVDLAPQDTSFPPLPQLVTLEIEHCVPGLSPDLIDELIRSYSPQIKVLRITHFYWKQEYGGLFNNLEEFTVKDVISIEDEPNIIHSLQAPKLSSLSLTLKNDRKSILENIFVQWLTDFKFLEKLNVQLYNWNWYPPVGVVLIPPLVDLKIPSLKCLTLRNKLQDVNFSFLQYFPSLDYLNVIPSSGNNTNKLETFDKWKLLGSPQTNIFETLPKLKEIHLAEGSWSHRTLHYTRAQYEYFKRFGGCPELAIRAMVKEDVR